ncbi:hypothetical protein K0U91_12520 [Chryseobacterium chendengshani]|uniref:hypothetical protein n=1 Tax=Chryseobacterium sp. LJ668 TaxID=2864040 RepID=UPI001C691BAB|nr:hypothetical protein [Chryseobacterium sp. LJ668]MBW8523594.1 hypothetical protein [Chryseobacterium sp. LJ668]QYK15877.1 hypothetical protein K0U91_12520 [Chryseobacterium sp. LJ668]
MKLKEKYIQISLVIITVVMTILRFLLNEKGRVNPDSINYMRFAHVFPVIDNTTTPAGYPVSIKLLTYFGLDEFWSSKAVGIFALLFIVFFAWKKNFYLKESIIICSLFSFLSIFSFTMSEALILPFVMILLYVAHLTITEKLPKWKAVFYISLTLILLYNIRYSSLFIIGGTGLFGLIFRRKKYGSAFIFSGAIGLAFVVLFRIIYIDYFNEDYLKDSLIIGLYPTSKLLPELFQGLMTSFNPFIHIADPNGGKINYAIYGIGFLNMMMMVYVLIKNKLNDTEIYYTVLGISGIICSYFVQYFYPVNALDYRLLAPFILGLWLVYFNKLFKIFDTKVYLIGILSLCSGMLFTWLSRGNYLENRKNAADFLKNEKLDKASLKFYIIEEKDLEKVQIAEIISTVNSDISLTIKPSDTLQKTTLTVHKVLQKIKIDKNKYQ